MNQWIIATLEPLAYADHALNVSIPAALDLVCSSPGPDDLAPQDQSSSFQWRRATTMSSGSSSAAISP